MQVDLTITISAILGASAVISPMLTAIINNKHQRKMKKMEYEHENEKASLFYKRGIFEDYLKYTGQCIAYATENGLQEYGKMYSLALIYFPGWPSRRIDNNQFFYSCHEMGYCQFSIKCTGP